MVDRSEMPDRPLAGESVEGVSVQVAKARSGNAQAWADLYESHRAAVRAVLLARAPLHDVEDLMQDVFVRALERLSSLRDDRAFSGWLMAIARNGATDALRRRAKRGTPLEVDVEARLVPSAEAREALTAIRSIPDAYREPLLMRLVAGMSGREIADRLGMTPGSVRVNLHRGMHKLRVVLGHVKESDHDPSK